MLEAGRPADLIKELRRGHRLTVKGGWDARSGAGGSPDNAPIKSTILHPPYLSVAAPVADAAKQPGGGACDGGLTSAAARIIWNGADSAMRAEGGCWREFRPVNNQLGGSQHHRSSEYNHG